MDQGVIRFMDDPEVLEAVVAPLTNGDDVVCMYQFSREKHSGYLTASLDHTVTAEPVVQVLRRPVADI